METRCGARWAWGARWGCEEIGLDGSGDQMAVGPDRSRDQMADWDGQIGVGARQEWGSDGDRGLRVGVGPLSCTPSPICHPIPYVVPHSPYPVPIPDRGACLGRTRWCETTLINSSPLDILIVTETRIAYRDNRHSTYLAGNTKHRVTHVWK